jgi:transcriptional regulator with XRE-family HTH domain
MSQDAFADLAGVAIGTLKNIERGVTEGWIESRIAIANALQLNLSDLYYDPAADVTIGDPDRLVPELTVGELMKMIRELGLARNFPLAKQVIEKIAMFPNDVIDMLTKVTKPQVPALRLFLEAMTDSAEAKQRKKSDHRS